MGKPLQIRRTERGFVILNFKDHYGAECSLQESSLSGPACIWLGVHANRMHLTQELVAEILPLLHHFVGRGTLPHFARPEIKVGMRVRTKPDSLSMREDEIEAISACGKYAYFKPRVDGPGHVYRWPLSDLTPVEDKADG